MKTEPKDVFLHLLAMVTLYISAISFVTLVFQIINYYIPDQLNSYYYSNDGILSTMRWAIAGLIVMFPSYLATMRFLGKTYKEDPEKRTVGVRKWLVYLTLLIAALITLGDLVSLLYTFLEGELTLRFFLKVATIFFMAGSIFYYYFTDIRSKQTRS